MQQLEHDRRRRPFGGALREPRSQCTTRTAARDRQPARVDLQFGPVVGRPLECRHRIVERRGERMFRRQAVVNRDDGALTAPGELHTLAVVDVQVAEDESP